MKQEDHIGGSQQQPSDPYAFTPSTPQPSAPQDDVFQPPLRMSHSTPESFPGLQAGGSSRIGSEPGGDMFAGMQEVYSQQAPARASPVHPLSSTPPRPGQFGPNTGRLFVIFKYCSS